MVQKQGWKSCVVQALGPESIELGLLDRKCYTWARLISTVSAISH